MGSPQNRSAQIRKAIEALHELLACSGTSIETARQIHELLATLNKDLDEAYATEVA